MRRLLHDWGRHRNGGDGFFILYICRGDCSRVRNRRGDICVSRENSAGRRRFFFWRGARTYNGTPARTARRSGLFRRISLTAVSEHGAADARRALSGVQQCCAHETVVSNRPTEGEYNYYYFLYSNKRSRGKKCSNVFGRTGTPAL